MNNPTSKKRERYRNNVNRQDFLLNDYLRKIPEEENLDCIYKPNES